MRYPIAAIGFIVAAFIFFVLWAVSSFLITTTVDAMTPLYAAVGNATLTGYLTLLPGAFAVICAIFFFTGIVLIFVLDSLSEESEYYYRR